jgi:hypothetical protein
MKLGDFDWYKRKNSSYLAQNMLHSENNRKNSAYFTFARDLLKDKAAFSLTHLFLFVNMPFLPD